jgi:hypothetical protein
MSNETEDAIEDYMWKKEEKPSSPILAQDHLGNTITALIAVFLLASVVSVALHECIIFF